MVQIKKQVLIVSGDIAVCQALQKHMQHNHTHVIYASSAVTALDIFTKQECCLVIIDICPDNKENIEILRIMRSTRHTPVLALIPSMKTDDKVALLHAGADICLDKTADIKLCTAQANALIQIYLEVNWEQHKQDLISFGTELVINPIYRQVIVNGESLALTRKEFDLLHCLASHPKQVFSLEQLYTYIWNEVFSISGDETVRVHIQTLRRKLAAMGKDFIQNIWGVGYKFVPPEQ